MLHLTEIQKDPKDPNLKYINHETAVHIHLVDAAYR